MKRELTSWSDEKLQRRFTAITGEEKLDSRESMIDRVMNMAKTREGLKEICNGVTANTFSLLLDVPLLEYDKLE